MKQTQQPGAFARFTGATRSYMQRRSQFARNLTGANLSRTLTAELLIGAAFFATALFTGSILTAAAFVLAGLLISRRACSTITRSWTTTPTPSTEPTTISTRKEVHDDLF